MVRLFFTGIKHSGKTTQAKLVSSLLGMDCHDSDDLILKEIGGSVRDFYRTHGKAAFMDAEYRAVEAFIKSGNESFILSLGGGAADNTPLMNMMRENGEIIYLRREEKAMFPVIRRHGLPAFLDAADPEGSFHELYSRRDRIYSEYASLTIDLGPYGDRDETAAKVLTALREAGYVQLIR